MQTSIVPVAVYPSVANTLTIRSITLGPPPSYFFQLENVVVVPPVAEQLDPTTGAVIVAAQDEQTIVTVLKSGNVSMTAEQWAAWPADADDDKVQLDAIAENLGLTRV
jgi:exosome complex RNA-binding protein Rrp42 (RNase PH superfamily)